MPAGVRQRRFDLKLHRGPNFSSDPTAAAFRAWRFREKQGQRKKEGQHKKAALDMQKDLTTIPANEYLGRSI
jgi:hypothetical protein